MDVENGSSSWRPEQNEATFAAELPALLGSALSAKFTGNMETALQPAIPDSTPCGDEKFGVCRETLFDFRDYGLD